VPEILALTGEGLLAEPGNPQSLADAIGRALATKVDRTALAAKMDAHSLDLTAQRYVETLRDAASRT
jgi:glycogen synthase